MKYYIYRNGKRQGPLSLHILKTMAQGGEFESTATLETEDGRQFRADEILPATIFDEPSEDAPSMIDIGAVDPFDANPFDVSHGDTEETFFDRLYAEPSNPWKYDGETSGVVWPSQRGSAATSKLFHFYDKRDCRWGPVSAADLKLLACEKRIDENTFIEASDGTLRRATAVRELAVIIRANAKEKTEKFAGSQIFLVVLLCVLGAILAIGVIVWALTHPLLFGRFLVYGAFGALALGVVGYIGKAAYEYISEHSDTFSKALKIFFAVSAVIGAFVALWKLLGVWLLLALFGLFVLLIAAGSCN